MEVVFRVTGKEAKDNAATELKDCTYYVGSTAEWFKSAVPEPTGRHFHTQLGVHFEEVGEMCDAVKTVGHPTLWTAIVSSVKWAMLKWALKAVSESLKAGKLHVSYFDAEELLDSIVDQKVTGTGVGVFAGFDVEGAYREVGRSNWSKFVDGKPIFNAQLKIQKGGNYTPPNLLPYIPYATKVLD